MQALLVLSVHLTKLTAVCIVFAFSLMSFVK